MPSAAFSPLMASAALLAAVVVLADSPAAPEAYIATSSSGRYTFHMFPANEDYGVAYEIKPSGGLKELWRIKGWYSFKVFLADDGSHLVRMGPWNFGSDPASDHLAVAFYRDGKLLKSYSTAELVKDHSRVRRSSSHYQWLNEREMGAEGPQLDWNGQFNLTTADGINYRFDVTTGEIKATETATDRADGWATVTDIDRLSIAVSLVVYPFPFGKLDEMIGLPKKTQGTAQGFGQSGVSQTLALTKPEKGKGHYALEIDIKTPTDGMNYLTKPVEGDVTGLRLVYFPPDQRRLQFWPHGDLARYIERLKKEPSEAKDTPRTLSEKAVRSLNGRMIFEH
jgi:hypothetical protein